MKPAFFDKATILLIAPERAATYRLDRVLGGAGYQCLACHNEGDAQRAAPDQRGELPLFEVRLGGGAGGEEGVDSLRDEAVAQGVAGVV